MKTTLILFVLATVQAYSSSTICANEVNNIQSSGLIIERETRVSREVPSVSRTIRNTREVRKSRNMRSERLLSAFREDHSSPVLNSIRAKRNIRLARSVRPDRKIYFVVPDKDCPKKLAFSFYAK